MEETRREVAIDGQLTRVLALTDYPRHVSPNWLGRLIDSGEPLDLSLHLEPLDSAEAVRSLTHRMVELQSSRMLDAKGGRIASVEREIAYEDVERLRDALERGDERVFSASLYLRLHGRTSGELDQSTARVDGTLGGMMAGARPALYEMLPGLLSCLPAGQDHLGRRRNLDTSSVATMIPFTSSQLAVARGLLYGVNVHNSSLVIFDPFGADQENANKVVFAKSGAGKSYACKVEALRALLLGIEYYVIDPEDEYGRICEAVGGQMVRLSGASPHRMNPFDLPPPGADDDVRDPLAERVLALQGLLSLMLAEPGAALGQRERGTLDGALYATYRAAGITDDPKTHGRPVPVLRDLLAVLRESNEPLGLANRLERYVDGSLGHVFSERTTANLDRPFVVFNVRDLEEELRPLATYLIADHVWGQVRRNPKPRVLLIDEAWSLMRYPEGARFLAQLARQARKRWLGLTTVTQDVEDFLASPEGHTVLANSSVQLLMRQDASTIATVAETFGLSAGERAFLLSCRRGEALFLARGNHIALKVEASPEEDTLAQSDPGFLAAARPGGGLLMSTDVEQLKRRHPIEAVVAAHGLRLERQGRRLVARCPFHEDRAPSFSVYPETQSFHCFGCGASGDVIDFVRRAGGLGFREAVEQLAGAASAEAVIPRRPAERPRRLSLDDRLTLSAACELYHETALRTPGILQYLETRGIPAWVAREYRIGYSDGRLLVPYLKRRRLSLKRAGELGLLFRSGDEAMAGRVVIPDLRGGPLRLDGRPRARTAAASRNTGDSRCRVRCWDVSRHAGTLACS